MSTSTVSRTLTGQYVLDPAHTRLGFVARHAMITKVRGSFNEIDGRGYFDADDPTRSSIEVVVQAASIDTRNSARDAHLRTNDFFEADRYPEIRFVSRSITVLDDTTYRVTGDLTIKDNTRPITIDLDYTGTSVDPYGGVRVGFEGSVTVNRRDWGLEWNVGLDAGGVLVGEKVVLEVEISAVKQEG